MRLYFGILKRKLFTVWHFFVTLIRLSLSVLVWFLKFLTTFLLKSSVHLILLSLLLFRIVTPRQYALLILSYHGISLLRQLKDAI